MAKKQTAKKSTAAKPRKKKETIVKDKEKELCFKIEVNEQSTTRAFVSSADDLPYTVTSSNDENNVQLTSEKVVVASSVDELPNTVAVEACECKEQEQDLIQSKNDCECKCEKHEEEAISEEPSTVESSEPTQEELEEQERERTRQRHKEFMAEMNKVPESDTREMLDFLGITELPKFTNAEADLWVRSVARVRKKDTSVSWCVLERRGVQKHAITKIFGRCAPIAQVGVPIPIEVMHPRYTAKVNKYNIESVRNYVLEKIGDKAKDMSSDELMDELVRIEIEFYQNAKRLGDE